MAHEEQAVGLELRKRAADGFQLEPQVAADLLAAHAQHDGRCGEATRLQPGRQVEQEGRQALLGVHAAQQQHHAVRTHDLAAQRAVQLLLQ